MWASDVSDSIRPGARVRWWAEVAPGEWATVYGWLIEFDWDPPGAAILGGDDGLRHVVPVGDQDAELEFLV